MSDVVKAILEKRALITSADSFWRDYITPIDFFQLIHKTINFSCINQALNAYSSSPVEKFQLLNFLVDRFDLKYEIDGSAEFVEPTGLKPFYYSQGRFAETLGYKPIFSSIEGIENELLNML